MAKLNIASLLANQQQRVALPAPEKLLALPAPFPGELYKYRAFDARSIQALFDEKIWVSKPASFNDPFDCAATFLTEFRSNAEIKASFEFIYATASISTPFAFTTKFRTAVNVFDEYNLEAFQETIKLFDSTQGIQLERLISIIRRMGIYSLSSTPKNLLLWSHYANEHKGFCIEYYGAPKAQGAESFLKVEYNDEPPDIYLLNDVQLRSTAAKFKRKEWKYEEEYRCVYESGNRLAPSPFQMKAIIFGLRMPHNQKKLMQQILQGRGLIYKQVVLSEGKSNEISIADGDFS